jgi:cell division protein FtsW
MRFDLFRPRDPHQDAMGVFVPALVLTGTGLICGYSFAGEAVLRQAVWAALGILVCLGVSRIPLRRLRRAAGGICFATGVLLLVALFFAPVIQGTRRWLVLPGIASFQPSELAKLAIVLFLARHIARGERRFLPAGWPVVALLLLVLLAPDLGTTVFLGGLACSMLLIAGARMGRVFTLAACAVPVILLVASQYPYMQRRLDFFRGKTNYQQQQALVALGSGGVLGQGLGAGRQKMNYLPAGHTDFVISNVGEELGFVGVALIGLLFALILINGLRVALAAARTDAFAFHMACGATLVVVFQAMINIAVATGTAPTKGISLPFLSHGGSNLLISLAAIGLVVNVGRSLEAKA